MIITNINYTESQINDLTVDINNGQYLWVAFGANLKKVSASNPAQIYYDIDVPVTTINKLTVSGLYVYLAVNDTINIGRRYSVSNPLTTYTDYAFPVGVTEKPIDVLVYNSNVYFLMPGDISGQNAIISQYAITGAFVQNIDLSTVVNARSFCLDSNNEIRVVCYTNPAILVRVYNLSTTPTYSTTQITD